jgi:hypothetical protein
MIRSLWIAKTGMEAQQTKLDTISQQPRQRRHQRLQARPRRVRGPDVPEPAPAGAASREQTQLPTGLQVGLGVRPVATVAHLHRRATCSRPATTWTSPSRARASSRCRCPTAPPATRATARLPGRRQRPARHQRRLCGAAGITIPAGAQTVTIAPTARSASPCSGQAPPQQVGQLQLAGFVNPAGLEPRAATCGPRPPPPARQRRRAGQQRPGHAAAGLRRGQQRQRGRGAGGDDPDPARLRAELQGHSDLRPDAAAPGAAVMVPPRCAFGAPPQGGARGRAGGAGPVAPAGGRFAPSVLAAAGRLQRWVVGASLSARARSMTSRRRWTWGRRRWRRRCRRWWRLPTARSSSGGQLPAAVRGPPRPPAGDTLVVKIVEKVSATPEVQQHRRQSGTLSGRHHRAAGHQPTRRCARASVGGTLGNAFDGKGTTESSNDFSGTITAIVTGVLPNGHLLISGEKQIGVNSNVDVLRFSGQVDPRASSPATPCPEHPDRQRARGAARPRPAGRRAGHGLAGASVFQYETPTLTRSLPPDLRQAGNPHAHVVRCPPRGLACLPGGRLGTPASAALC